MSAQYIHVSQQYIHILITNNPFFIANKIHISESIHFRINLYLKARMLLLILRL